MSGYEANCVKRGKREWLLIVYGSSLASFQNREELFTILYFMYNFNLSSFSSIWWLITQSTLILIPLRPNPMDWLWLAFSLRYVWKYHICCYINFTRYFVSDEFGKIKHFPRKATVPKMKGISRMVESVRVGKDWGREVQLKLKSDFQFSFWRKMYINSFSLVRSFAYL